MPWTDSQQISDIFFSITNPNKVKYCLDIFVHEALLVAKIPWTIYPRQHGHY